jgi:hypothetical protein
MHPGQARCWQSHCNRYVPSSGGEEHIGKIFAFGAVLMAISLYYLYKDLFPDHRPTASNDPDDQACEEEAPIP